MFARREAKTRIQQRDWLAKKFVASATNHVAEFLFSLRVARTNSPSGKRALISTTPPLNESSRGAVEWNIWKEIGEEFMVKSNINDWIVCQPSNGSIITKKEGPISCQNIKNVGTACSGVAPEKLKWCPRGLCLVRLVPAFSFYYLFNAGTDYYWPVHDPCGTGRPNQKKGVSNPGGQIYLR